MVARFSDIIGQERAVDLLRRYISQGAAPHGLLFSGEEGVGKETAAMAFVAALLCRAPVEDGACGECRDCRLIASSSHPNLSRIALEENSKFLRIEEIRSLQEELSMKAFSDRPRAVILSPADRMTPQAANALLKTLEEPPPGAHIILIAHRGAAMPPTIVSRCQRVSFFPLPVDLAAEILARHPEAAGYSPEEVRLASAMAGGSPGRALELLPDIESERRLWLGALTNASAAEILSLAETFKKERGEPGRLATPLTLLRDLALLSSGGAAAIINDDLRDELSFAAVRPPAGGWNTAFRELLAISRMPPQPQKQLMLEAFFLGMRKKDKLSS